MSEAGAGRRDRGRGHPLRHRADRAPEGPGCYLFRSAREALYVGKARSLRQRLRSYFQGSAGHSPRILRMLAEATELDLIVTGTAVEALILENNLIKKERPRFNVLLRDDKNFPYLKLTVQDPFPRLVLVRRARTDGSLYFGPYLPASMARRTLRMASRYFKVAPCHEKLDGTRGRPCLYYHLNQCLGPCTEGLTTQEEYRRAVEDLRLFLTGRNRDLLDRLRAEMSRASERMEYERAAHYRDLTRDVERMARKQNFSRVGLEDQDYFHFHREGDQAVLELFMMRAGLVQSRHEFSFADLAGEPDPEFLAQALQQYYAEGRNIPREVYVPREIPGTALLERWLRGLRGDGVSVRVPRRGVKSWFLETVRRNAELAFQNRFRTGHTDGVESLEALREALDLEDPPQRIEGFDISQLQGSSAVASMVVWEAGRPRRSAYRHFRIRTVVGQDDFASMAEVVARRYRRLVSEGRRMPDLILIDGGKGQVGAAHEALKQSGAPPVPMAGLAKREEEIHLPGRPSPIRLDPGSPGLRLLQQVRDEAHRFAVTYHRKVRSREALASELTAIPGVGPSRASRLLRGLGSLEAVRAATEADLARHVPRSVARAVRAHFGPPPAPEAVPPSRGSGGTR